MAERAQTQVKPTAVPVLPAAGSSLQRKCACGTHTLGDRCDSCKGGAGLLQRKASGRGGYSEVPPIVHDVLRSPGQPLDAATRAFFEPRFGHDFSHVRVHTDARAAESARAVNALAYTVGRDLVFGAEQFRTETGSGRRLLAHELAHTLQQPVASSPVLSKLQITDAGHPSERTADEVADALMRGDNFTISSGGQVSLARQTATTPQAETSSVESSQTNAQDNGPTVTLVQEKDEVLVLVDGVPIYWILLPGGQGSVSMTSELDATKTLKITLSLPQDAKGHWIWTPESKQVAVKFKAVEIKPIETPPGESTTPAVTAKPEHKANLNPTFRGHSITPGSSIIEKFEISFKSSSDIYADTSAMEAKLASLAKLLKQYPKLKMNVEGNVFNDDPGVIKGSSEAALTQYLFYLNGKDCTARQLMLARASRVRETLQKTFKVTNIITITDGAIMDNSEGLKIFVTIINPAK